VLFGWFPSRNSHAGGQNLSTAAVIDNRSSASNLANCTSWQLHPAEVDPIVFLWCLRLNGTEEPFMRRFQRMVAQFIQDETGASSVEYAITLSLILVVCITTIKDLGTRATNTFNYTSNQIKGSGS
jgi:pilus assembly protein Flp/PilA